MTEERDLVQVVICILFLIGFCYFVFFRPKREEPYTPSNDKVKKAHKSMKKGSDTYIYPDGMFSVKWTPWK